MAELSLKRVKTICQQDKDIVYGYIKRMQNMLPGDKSFYIIVQLIQDICLLYFHHIVDSKILTDDEQIKLYTMVNEHTNNKYMNEWKLLFRASRDGPYTDDAWNKIDNKNNTLCIIETKQKNVFGGFHSLKWDKVKSKSFSMWKEEAHTKDSDAFVYLIRSSQGLKPKIYPVQNDGRWAVQNYPSGYLSFGQSGGAFYVYGGDKIANSNWKIYTTYGARSEQYNLEQGILNGNDEKSIPIDVEVFQLCRSLE